MRPSSISTHMLTSQQHRHQYYLPEPPGIFPNLPLPPQEPAVFGIDFIYLMTAVLMTLRTWLMVSQAPQHLWNEDWMRAWRVRGGLILKRVEWNGVGATERTRGAGNGAYAGDRCLSPEQTRAADTGQKLITTPWTNFYAVTQMKEISPALIRDWVVGSKPVVGVCFQKLRQFLEQTCVQIEFFCNYYSLEDKKKDISFLKGVRSKWKSPSG